MKFQMEVYWYVTGTYRGRRVVFGPAWKDVQPNAARRRCRIALLGNIACAEQCLVEHGCTNVRRALAVSPHNPAVRCERTWDVELD